MAVAGPGDEVPLEDIDKILALEDPDFAKGLEEVRAVEADKNVIIEAAAIDETMEGDESVSEGFSPAAWARRGIARLRAAILTARTNFKTRIKQLGVDTLIFLKTRPKEFLFFALAISRKGVLGLKRPLQAFWAAPRLVQLAALALLGIGMAAYWVFFANLKGIWIPHLTEPILQDLAEHAGFVETYDPADGAESFYSAFPQEINQYLFSKMKVNLRRRPENPNPMGAFEVVVDVDSKDTAVELRDREVELNDLLQRLFEDELVTDLETDAGKRILKGRIRKELNAKLTQGWVKEVHFKTFILKP